MKSRLSWGPFLYPFAGVFYVIIMICLRTSESPYIFYHATKACFLITIVLLIHYKKRIFCVSIVYLLIPLLVYIYYFPISNICFNSQKFLSISFILAILLGFLSSLISFMGSFHNSIEEHDAGTGQILVSASFLSFVVALIILYVTTAMNMPTNDPFLIEGFRMKTQQVGTLVMQILPIGSWVVPIQSYFYGKSYLTGKAGRKRFSFLFSGLILSFLLGFVFGVLAFAVAVASMYAHPVHYPFMLTSWLVIAFYIFLLESDTWDFGHQLDSIRRLLKD